MKELWDGDCGLSSRNLETTLPTDMTSGLILSRAGMGSQAVAGPVWQSNVPCVSQYSFHQDGQSPSPRVCEDRERGLQADSMYKMGCLREDIAREMELGCVGAFRSLPGNW